MLRFLHRAILLVVLLLPTLTRADGLEVPRDGFEFGADITGRGETMNYGPFLSQSVFLAGRVPATKPKEVDKVNLGLRTGKPPLILKAIVVGLGGKHACAFDTEMCSIPAAWTGGFLDIGRTNLNGYKGGDLSYLRFPAIFQNGQTPGWSTKGDFKDPRLTPFGPLPKDIGHYRGLYLHGQKTILSYSVGASQVLELPTMLTKDNTHVFCRTVRIDKSNAEKVMLLGELQEAVGTVEGATAMLRRKDTTLSVAVSGVLAQARLQVQGERAVLHLPPHRDPLTFQVFVARDADSKAFAEMVAKSGPAEDLPSLCHGGPPRWEKEITLMGRLGKDDGAYVVDEVPLPDDNPWKSWMRPAAFDFLSDGRAVLSTWNGDVWIVSGLDDTLNKVVWRRFATGLYDGLGVKVVNGVIHVLGRDQITRLHDLNADGEADFYENFNNDSPAAPSFHGFALDLNTDSAGNFYFHRGAHRVAEGTPMHGCVLKVSKDGTKIETLGSGLREANGMAIGPDDLITIADNQGNWVPYKQQIRGKCSK